MPGDRALLSPTNDAEVVELSRSLFRKRVLPLGTINYKGRKITFDKQYLSDLASSFKANAYDAVPFVIAKDDNAHTMDPERVRGEVKAFELTPDGLDMLFDLSPDAADLVRQFPKLGVSARIIEQLERADGQKFPRAIQHVLGTLDPRVTGMGAWQEVALADEVKDTIDLTKEEVTTLSDISTTAGGGGATPPQPPQTNTAGGDTVDVGASLETITAPGHTVNVTVNQPSNGPQGTSKDPMVLPGFDEDDGDDEDMDFDDITDQELADASLSNPVDEPAPVDLANQELRARVAQLELENARQRYINEARGYIEAGVPPVMVQLAGQVLSLPQAPVIDLSNSQQIDIGQLLRDMLEQTKGFLELANEMGTSDTGDVAQDRADQVLANWKGGK